MKINRILAALALITLGATLTGCDSAKATLRDTFTKLGSEFGKMVGELPPMTYVIWPGYEIWVDGVGAHVHGKTMCPVQERDGFMLALFGPAPPPPPDCIIIEPDTATVEVMYLKAGEKVGEVWQVERRAGLIMLRRPGGDFVAGADSTRSAISSLK